MGIDRISDLNALERRISDLREWLHETAPECFSEQKHSEEGTQERVYWHHGYMTGLRDALRLLVGDSPIRRTRTEGKTDTSFSD